LVSIHVIIKKLSIIKKIKQSKMPNLDWTCTKVDLIRKIKDGPGSNRLDWYKEFFPFSDANKFMGVVLSSEKLQTLVNELCYLSKKLFVENT